MGLSLSAPVDVDDEESEVVDAVADADLTPSSFSLSRSPLSGGTFETPLPPRGTPRLSRTLSRSLFSRSELAEPLETDACADGKDEE